MALILEALFNGYDYMNRKIADPRALDYPLMSSPFPIITIMGVYYVTVIHLGPRLMKDRAPFQLDRIIQVYNVVQVAMCLWLAERGLTLCWLGPYNWFCQPVDYSDDPKALKIMSYVYIYFLVKLSDMLDTIFFVLRKRQNQVTFLHVFHHTLMPVMGWVDVKYVAGGHTTFLGTLNCMVHVVMYSYYLITNIYPEQKKNMWWKKHITQMQILHFFLIIVHMGQVFLQPTCSYPRVMASIITVQTTLVAALFCNFYRNAYLNDKTVKLLKKSK